VPVLLALPSLHLLFSCCTFVFLPLSPWPAVVDGVCYSKAGASIIKMQFNFSCALILPASPVLCSVDKVADFCLSSR